ncbi:MAG: hypothetical protein AAGD07_11760 [Planctomycetota bacterium]
MTHRSQKPADQERTGAAPAEGDAERNNSSVTPLTQLLGNAATPADAAKRFTGLRIEDDRLTVAVASPGNDVLVDQIVCEDDSGWLSTGRWESLAESLERLKRTHSLDQQPIAVSLSGDFCVTRVVTGPADRVEEELDALGGRVPRYLQLGPGGKVTGVADLGLDGGMRYALTSVGNRYLIESLYSTLRGADLQVAWIEPSLVSLSRLVGQFGYDSEEPLLIASGLGRSWEVGISFCGRLMLDYRPATASESSQIAKAIGQHLTRLKRFCGRHRGMPQSGLDQMLVFATPEKSSEMVSHFEEDDSLSVQAIDLESVGFQVHHPNTTTDAQDQLASVAAMLPRIETGSQTVIPDLLQTIRTDDSRSTFHKIRSTFWPAAAAALLLICGYAVLSAKRTQTEKLVAERERVESGMMLTQVRLSRLQREREIVNELSNIDRQAFHPPTDQIMGEIAACLPTTSWLSHLRIDAEQKIFLEGSVAATTDVYEIVGYLRRLPKVANVALLGTSPGSDGSGAQFSIRLQWQPPEAASEDTRDA